MSVHNVRQASFAIIVEDCGEGRSITNGAEDLIAWLARAGYDMRKPVMYRDTDGRWDGLAVRDGAFSGFYPLNAAGSDCFIEARDKLLQLLADRDPRLGDAIRPEVPA